MHDTASKFPNEMLEKARAGDSQILNQLIDHYRPYLKLLARLNQNPQLAAKLDDSDLVQEASVLAARNFADFRGNSEVELTAWLRTTMARVTAQSLRHYGRKRRDVELERDLYQSYDRSSCQLAAGLPDATAATPSQQAMVRERAVLVASALEELPEHYREIILLRDFEGLTLQEVGKKTGRSPDSVRKMWARAIIMVRQHLEGKV